MDDGCSFFHFQQLELHKSLDLESYCGNVFKCLFFLFIEVKLAFDSNQVARAVKGANVRANLSQYLQSYKWCEKLVFERTSGSSDGLFSLLASILRNADK